MTLFLTLVGIALLIAIILFLFNWFWYSKIAFGRFMIGEERNVKSNTKITLSLEFVSCLLISFAATALFAPFDWFYGVINGLIISVSIVLPLTLSDAIWSAKPSFKMFFIKVGNKIGFIVLAFVLAGALNSLVLPILAQNANLPM